MAERIPNMPFYWDDFFGDEDVQAMSNECVGIYMRLMYAAWKGTPPCTITGNDIQLAAIAGVTVARWGKLKLVVMQPWDKTDDGRWIQKRLFKEFQEAKRRIRKASKAGKASGLARRSKSAAAGDEETNASSTLVQRPLNHPNPKPNPKPSIGLDLESPNPLSGDWQIELARGLSGYAREKAGLALEFSKLTELALEFGWPEVTQALEHRASMKPHRRWRGKGGQPVANKIGVLVNTIKAFAAGNGPDNEGEVETYQEWRARREAEIGALR